MKYKLIALDLDGTLKNSKNCISEKTKETLIQLQEKGVIVVLASGRPTPGLRHEAKELNLDQYGGYLLSYNGARVYDIINDSTIYEQTISVEDAIKAYRRSKNYDLCAMSYEGMSVLSEDISQKYVQVEGFINDLELVQVENLEEHIKGSVHKILLCGEPDYVASVIDEYKEPLEATMGVFRSSPWFIEIVAQNIDKANSLNKLAEYLGIKREEIIAFGDGYNDLTMIEYAGCGVAMGNGVDAVKEKADFVTRSNDEDGIAYALSIYFDEILEN